MEVLRCPLNPTDNPPSLSVVVNGTLLKEVMASTLQQAVSLARLVPSEYMPPEIYNWIVDAFTSGLITAVTVHQHAPGKIAITFNVEPGNPTEVQSRFMAIATSLSRRARLGPADHQTVVPFDQVASAFECAIKVLAQADF